MADHDSKQEVASADADGSPDVSVEAEADGSSSSLAANEASQTTGAPSSLTDSLGEAASSIESLIEDHEEEVSENGRTVKRRGVYLLPNLFTTGALFCGF